MVDMTFPELNSDLGTATSDGLRNVANTAANFACQLYANSPASAIGVDPTGLGAFNNALWSKLCGPRELPSLPPAPPFSGGQCLELYNVNLSVTFGNADGTSGPTDTRQFNGVVGPLKGWIFRRPPGTVVGTEVAFVTATEELSFGTQALGEGVPSVSVNSIVPVDGSDECGNPPPAFPPSVPDPGDLSVDVNVDFGGLTIPVTVEFQPIINFSPNVFVPVISVNVGPVNVQFSPGGVTFAPNFNLDVDIITSPAIDTRPSPPTPKPLPAADECDLTPVLTRLNQLDDKYDELLDCERCEKCYEEVVTTYNVLNSNVVNSLVGIPVRAVVQLVDRPRNLPVQSGNGAPNIVFAGWFSWRKGNGQVTRQRLDYETNVFLAPEGVTGFSYTGTYGTTWQVTFVGKQEIDCPPT